MRTDLELKQGTLVRYTGPGGEVTVPEGVTVIGDRAFYDCLDLTGIALPETVVRIGREAFYNCQGLTELLLPQKLLELGERAFYNCWRLTRAEVPAGVTRLPKGVFEECQGLTCAALFEGLQEVEGRAFGHCHQLKYLRFPDTVTVLHRTALAECDALERLQADSVPLGDLSGKCRLAVLTDLACRLTDGGSFPADRLGPAVEAIRKERKKLYPCAVRHEGLLRLMLREGLVPARDLRTLLDEADRQDDENAKAVIQAYQTSIGG